MNPQPPELFSQRPIRSDFARVPSYRTRRIITVSVLVLLVAGGLRLWVFNGSALPPGEVPTVKAEGPYKQRPEQPGGLDIPHQDIQVYQSLDSTDGTKPVEHLLPPPETPQPVAPPAPNTAPAPAVASAPPAGTETQSAPPVEDLSPAKPDTVQASPPAPQSVPAPVTTPAPSPPVAAVEPSAPPQNPPAEIQPAEKPAPPPAAAKPPKQALTIDQVIRNSGASPSDRIVQLASMQGESGAQAMADKLQSRYASILGDVHLHLTRADLGARGVYYRIQSPPVSGNQASTICAEIKKLKAGCILVRP